MTSEEANNIADDIKKLLKFLTWATVALYVIVIIMIIFLFTKVNDINSTLCTFKGDLQSRVTQTRDYLDKHPEGFAGIPAASLQVSLANQEATIKSLNSLDCSEPPPPITGTTSSTTTVPPGTSSGSTP